MKPKPHSVNNDQRDTSTRSTDVCIKGVELYYLPVETRVPLKFGTETLTSVTCARVRVVVEDRHGRLASGWGETPLHVQWVWPSEMSYAILSLCWAKAHDMHVMVQDLTNPMLAQIPHVLLAAYADTMMGVESNAMQFYPRASDPEAAVHPGIYQRRGGKLQLETIHGSGFGYRLDEINRKLTAPVKQIGITSL